MTFGRRSVNEREQAQRQEAERRAAREREAQERTEAQIANAGSQSQGWTDLRAMTRTVVAWVCLAVSVYILVNTLTGWGWRP